MFRHVQSYTGSGCTAMLDAAGDNRLHRRSALFSAPLFSPQIPMRGILYFSLPFSTLLYFSLPFSTFLLLPSFTFFNIFSIIFLYIFFHILLPPADQFNSMFCRSRPLSLHTDNSSLRASFT